MTRPLNPTLITSLKLGEVLPTGWLKNQLETQNEGLSGHLDEFWPDIMDSEWIGGKAEGWERFPYWLDGVIPLAFLIESKSLIEKVERYINYILDHQHNDGWFGPTKWGKEPNYDVWPNMILCKAFIQFFEVSGDKRIISALIAYYRKLNDIIDEYTLGKSWAQIRWMDCVWGIHWLIDHLSEKNDINAFLLALAEKMKNQGYNWKEHFDNFFYIHFKKDSYAEIIYSNDILSPNDSYNEQSGKNVRKYDLRSHVVNNAMGIKCSAIWSRQSRGEQDKQAIFTAISTLDKYHGQATGMFSGDEHLAGKNPSQGTELCSVVEYLFSLETVIPIIGCNPKCVSLLDRLEKICFNALPATFLPDMWAHQYDQQVNQVQAKRVRKPIYATNGKDSNIYGLEPNFGCCTANMHQGWPKFVEYGLWAKDREGLVCLAYAPCKISTDIADTRIEIHEITSYPFSDTIDFSIHISKSKKLSMKFRIPEWSIKPTIQINQEQPLTCEPGDFFNLSRIWKDGDEIKLIIPAEVEEERRYNDALILKRGSLLFSYNPTEEKSEMIRWSKSVALRKNNPSLKIPPKVRDWEIYPRSQWQYALVEPITAKFVKLEENIKNFRNFNNKSPPVKLIVNVLEIKNWDLQFDAASPPPLFPEENTRSVEEIELIPYGCTNIRITEFPTIKR